MDEGEALGGRVILITGAAGFTGAHACRYFAGLGMKVAALVHGRFPASGHEAIRYYTCDLLNSPLLAAIVREVAPDFVLHLGGKNSVPESWANPLLYMETNVFPLFYLLAALRPYPACRVLIAGSRLSVPLAAPYRPPHPYSLSKSLQKAIALSWGGLFEQDIMVAEPSNLTGPGPSTGICSLLGRRLVQTELGQTAEPFRLSSRWARRDFLDVRDAVRAYGCLLAYGNCGEEYPVCSGVERSLLETADTLQEIAGHRIELRWEGADPPPKELPIPPVEPAFLSGLGWKPLIPFTASLTDCIGYFRGTKGELQ